MIDLDEIKVVNEALVAYDFAGRVSYVHPSSARLMNRIHIPALIAEVERLQNEVERLRKVIEQNRLALVSISSVLGTFESQGGSHSLPYVLKRPKIAIDVAIIGIANLNRESSNG